MPRYIDADVIDLECVSDTICQWQAQNAIDDTPTADVVEVVRCKDCKYCEWYIKAHYNNGIEVESHECRKYKMAVTRDWFCADGERREDNA